MGHYGVKRNSWKCFDVLKWVGRQRQRLVQRKRAELDSRAIDCESGITLGSKVHAFECLAGCVFRWKCGVTRTRIHPSHPCQREGIPLCKPAGNVLQQLMHSAVTRWKSHGGLSLVGTFSRRKFEKIRLVNANDCINTVGDHGGHHTNS